MLSLTGMAQGIKPIHLLNYYELFEQSVDARKVMQEAARLDSMRIAYALKFAPEDTIKGWKTWKTVENHTFGKNRGDLTMIVDPNSLHPYFRDKVLQLVARCKAKGIELAFVEAYRTHAKQAEYKGMGKKFTSSGAGRSKHQYGLAVDIVPIVGDSAVWHNKVLWRKIGVIGEQLGLRWGGRWRHPYDPGHFEWSGGLDGTALAAGIEPYIPKKNILYPCLKEDLDLLKKFWTAWEVHQSSIVRK
jgi:hypothetical protein